MKHRPCLEHCPRAVGALRGPLRALGAVAAAAVAVRLAWLVVSSVAEAFALGVFAACGVSLVVLVRLLRPARNARIIRAQSAVPQIRGRNENRAALPAPPLAIGAAPVVPGVVVAAEGGKVER